MQSGCLRVCAPLGSTEKIAMFKLSSHYEFCQHFSLFSLFSFLSFFYLPFKNSYPGAAAMKAPYLDHTMALDNYKGEKKIILIKISD